jgi:hypothetical protein
MPTMNQALAYKRIGIDKEKLATIPNISLVLAKVLAGLEEKGLSTDPYFYLDLSGNSDALRVMHAYKSVPGYVRKLLSLEAFCLAAQADPNVIVDSIMASISRVSALTAGVKLSTAQPEIVDTTIEAAKNIDNGHKDRRLFMQVSGLMPMSRGAQTIVNVKNTASASSAPVQQAIVVPAPPPEQTVRRLSERLQAVRALPETITVEE